MLRTITLTDHETALLRGATILAAAEAERRSHNLGESQTGRNSALNAKRDLEQLAYRLDA